VQFLRSPHRKVTFASWNRLDGWLRQVEELRRAAWSSRSQAVSAAISFRAADRAPRRRCPSGDVCLRHQLHAAVEKDGLR